MSANGSETEEIRALVAAEEGASVQRRETVGLRGERSRAGGREPFKVPNPALEMGEQRGWRGRLVKWDRNASYQLFRWYHERIGSRVPLKILEISGHGVPWLAIPPLIFVFRSTLTDPQACLLFNFYLGSLSDLVYVGILKPATRRARPAYNSCDAQFTIHAVDQYSFPSGHTTRVVYIAAFLYYVAFDLRSSAASVLVSPVVIGFVTIWAAVVSYSRIALGRHHVLDVIGGVAIGLLNMATLLAMWVPEKVVMRWRRDWLFHAASVVTQNVQRLTPLS